MSAEVDGGDEEHAAVGQVAGNPEDHDGNVKRNDEGEIKQIFKNLSIYYKNTSRREKAKIKFVVRRKYSTKPKSLKKTDRERDFGNNNVTIEVI